jgi:methylamine utilization protein MauE
MKRETTIEIISSLFVLLFLYTGIMKIIDHDIFYEALLKSPLLINFAWILSILVPLGELLIVISLLIPRTRKWGLYSSFILMGIFTIYVGFMLYFRSDRPCTCGGLIRLMNWHQHFYFNTAFTFMALFAIWLEKKNRQQKEELNSTIYA